METDRLCIAEWAAHRGLTPSRLGRLADVGYKTAATACQGGHEMSTATFKKFARVLGVSIPELYSPPPES